MSLSDIMSHMSLTTWPQIAMVLFLAVFAATAWRTFGRSRREEFERAGLLPLEDDSGPVNERRSPR